jgi:multidrug efflux pump subunit AcrA (membrane-fusion protein)
MTRSLILTLTLVGCTVLLISPAIPADARKALQADSKSSGVVIERCLVTVIEQVAVPAKEAGVLEKLLVREGTFVTAGQQIGQLDVEKSALEKQQAELELLVADKNAENDVNVRFAKASWEVAEAHYIRALKANEQVKDSVAPTEVAERKLNAAKAKLQIEQAERDLDVARVTVRAKAGLVELADANVRRRTIVAPTSGMIVELHKLAGEFLNPGDPVIRVMRVDRLRVEGFLNADKHGQEINGRPVMVEALLPGGKREKFAGKIVFVSPEIEPVTNHIRVWAEVENPQLHLRPGARASMIIEEAPAK